MNISDLSNHAWIEDWANMTERQVTARLTLAMEQYLRGPNLFNPDFVYGGGAPPPRRGRTAFDSSSACWASSPSTAPSPP